MSAMQWPTHLLTLDDFEALPEDNTHRFEVQEGVLIVTPRPASLHARTARNLATDLASGLPHDWEPAIEMDLVLTVGALLGVRVPDVVVTRREIIDQNIARLHPEDVLLAIEIVSPGSRRTDTVVKPLEYAEAGIPHYWVIDLDPPVSLTAFHLVEEFAAYLEAPAVTGVFSTSAPFPLRVDLDALTRR